MNWNSARYCIGFPPEQWYDVADELGFLIQDEFPIWYVGENAVPRELRSEELAREYAEWMQERWNHPCVAIWDAQNETITAETGKAIRAVRGLDLSHRPWDNGWSPAQRPAIRMRRMLTCSCSPATIGFPTWCMFRPCRRAA